MKPQKMKLGEDIIKMYQPFRNDNANWKKISVNKQQFQIYGCYEPIDVIGKGAYGVVIAAKNKEATDKTRQLVAIKKIDKSFQHKIFAKRTLRELKLQRLLSHENVLGIQTILLPRSRDQFDDVYVISQLMDNDLTQLIKSSKPLTQEQYKFFLYQLLRGLKYIHSAKIIHRDLKPRNLLINSKFDLKICDFGLARATFKDVKANVMTDYVTTRWYRAPQLLLSATQYTTAVDMWSVACIFAQMIKRRPFLPGKDTEDQIQLICQNVDCTGVQDVKFISQGAKKMIKVLQKRRKNPIDYKKAFPDVSESAIDLLQKMLIFDPEKRITVQEALKHPYLADYHLQADEPIRSQLDPRQFEFEDYNLTTQQYKDLLYQQILLYNHKQFANNYYQKLKKGQSVISHILTNSNKDNIDPNADQDD